MQPWKTIDGGKTLRASPRFNEADSVPIRMVIIFYLSSFLESHPSKTDIISTTNAYDKWESKT